MNSLVKEAICTSKNSTKNDRKNFHNMRKKFWKIVSRIRKEVSLTSEEQQKLTFHLIKMK